MCRCGNKSCVDVDVSHVPMWTQVMRRCGHKSRADVDVQHAKRGSAEEFICRNMSYPSANGWNADVQVFFFGNPSVHAFGETPRRRADLKGALLGMLRRVAKNTSALPGSGPSALAVGLRREAAYASQVAREHVSPEREPLERRRDVAM